MIETFVNQLLQAILYMKLNVGSAHLPMDKSIIELIETKNILKRSSIFAFDGYNKNSQRIKTADISLYKLDSNSIYEPNATKKGNFFYAENLGSAISTAIQPDSNAIFADIGSDRESMKQMSLAINFILIYSAFLKVVSMEYGSNAFKELGNLKLANSSQWWAYMHINDFNTHSITHANTLLKTSKASSLPASLNGSSALFPTNLTYASIITMLNSRGTEVNKYVELIKYTIDEDLVSKLLFQPSKVAIAQMYHVMDLHKFQIAVLAAAGIYKFASFSTGYYNVWRYQNFNLIKATGG